MESKLRTALQDILNGVPLGCLTIEECDMMKEKFGNSWKKHLSDFNFIQNYLLVMDEEEK